MVNWRKQLVPTVAATSLLLASGAVANGISQAEERKGRKAILIPGAALQADQPDLSDRRHHLPGYREPLSRRQSRVAGGRLLAERTRL